MKIHIPLPMRALTHGERMVEDCAPTVHELIDRLDSRFPGFRERLSDSDGEVKRYVNIFVNGQSIRNLQGQQTVLHAGDDVRIVPVVAGGAGAAIDHA